MRSILRSPRFWLGIAISVVALALAARGVTWSAFWAELVGADYGWLIPGALVVVVGQVLRAIRWRAMFATGPRPSLSMAFAILSVGYLTSALLPLRLGDLVRPWLIGTRTPAGATEALATVLLERVVDLLTVVALVAVVVPVPLAGLLVRLLGPGAWSDPRVVQGVLVAAVALLFVGLGILARAAAPGRAVTVRLLLALGLRPGRAVRIGDLAQRFLGALGALRRPRTALVVFGWSVIVWLVGGLQFWFVARAFHLDVSYAVAVLAMGATALWAILPSSPGYVGVFHHAIRVSVPAVAPQVTADQALSYAVVLHGLTIAMLVALGMVGLLMLGMSLPDLVRRVGAGPATAV